MLFLSSLNFEMIRKSLASKSIFIKCLEVVSKPRIRFKGPAWRRDFASDLFQLRCSAPPKPAGFRLYFQKLNVRNKAGQSDTNIVGPLEPFELFKSFLIRCEIPLHKAGRWGFDTTSMCTYRYTRQAL